MLTNYEAIAVILLTAVRAIINTDSCICPKNSNDIQTEAPGQKLSNLESIEQVTERKRKRCCPYNFDGKLCRTVGDRVLCGYNRNVGGPKSGEGDLELQNGCRIRQGRLECGYNQPPFLNSRRPPIWDYMLPEEEDDIKPIDLDVSSKEEKLQKLSYQSTNMPQLTTRCVEIKERIVCRKI